MGQLKNYKKEKKFEHTLLNIENIELSTYEIDCTISYKKTVPLNIFEKYSIRLIEKADEIYSDMNIEKIAQLLHLDENLIRENLENLESIDMLHGVNSDFITINKDENSVYLQYENKFKIEHIVKNYHLTQKEYENKDDYILKEFEKNFENKDKKFKNHRIDNENSSIKNVNLLNYSNGNFLIFSKDGINSQNDLKFMDENSFSDIKKDNISSDNIFCHYDEFLPLLRDRLHIDKNEIIVISSQKIVKENLAILPSKRDNDIYILSNSNEKYKRIFNILYSDFVWIGDKFYRRDGDYIFEKNDTFLKEKIKNSLKSYFRDKIIEIEPNYNLEKINNFENKLNKINKTLTKFEFQTSKKIEEKIQKINKNKNELYGLRSKKSKVRSDLRKKIDGFENSDNQKELKKYDVYLENREKILNLKKLVEDLEIQKKEISEYHVLIDNINYEKSQLVSKENKEKIAPFEKEIKNIERLKI